MFYQCFIDDKVFDGYGRRATVLPILDPTPINTPEPDHQGLTY